MRGERRTMRHQRSFDPQAFLLHCALREVAHAGHFPVLDPVVLAAGAICSSQGTLVCLNGVRANEHCQCHAHIHPTLIMYWFAILSAATRCTTRTNIRTCTSTISPSHVHVCRPLGKHIVRLCVHCKWVDHSWMVTCEFYPIDVSNSASLFIAPSAFFGMHMGPATGICAAWVPSVTLRPVNLLGWLVVGLKIIAGSHPHTDKHSETECRVV
jgi:hypothetical protein